MIIKENTICYISELGHNNFWYPSTTKALIKENCEAARMSWLGGGSKVAIKVLKSCLMPIDITQSTTQNISPPTKNDYTIVWIEKNV
tara:strand:+ start:291 stop:551 length:261 start_codon:yes stop_codon:yes gene_type:complete